MNAVTKKPSGNPLSLFQKPSKPVYLKMGLYGDTGSGKTYTAGLFAIGIAKALKSKKPVLMFDTEDGAGFLMPLFEKAGIEFNYVKSRSFKKLVEATREAEKSGSVFIVDSISHVWEELIEAYMTKKGRRFIQINEWGEIKTYWKQFTTAYLTSNINAILLGRAQDVTENTTSDSGQKDFQKIGERMKGEKYMGYEPHLLIRMDKIQDLQKNIINHVAYVEKDRTDHMTGATVLEPTFEAFKSIWDAYDHTGVHTPIDTDDSVDHISSPDYSIEDLKRRRTIATEKIQNVLVRYISSTSNADKIRKMNLLKQVFGTDAWSEITDGPIHIQRVTFLEEGIDKLEAACKKETGISLADAKLSLKKKAK